MGMNSGFHEGKRWRRVIALLAAISLLVTLLPVGTHSIAAAADSNDVTVSGYEVQINETITGGFTHPGVGLTKEVLENMREQVLLQQEPWYSYYVAMTSSAAASKTVTSSNASQTDPTKPASDAFNSQGFNSRFISDGLKAYTQALMYYISGDETYRSNAMRIIQIWSQMDPSKYVYFNDAHIHTGIPLNRMVTAAEILRYTSYQTEELGWTAQDTTNFTTNLINPVIETFQHDNNRFMNQHNYPLLGAMAGYIFTNNQSRYDEAVEWFTVNSTAQDQGFNGSLKQLFRLMDTDDLTGEPLVEPVIQHVEMGRDQAHGGGDLTNAAILSRMLLAQGTKVDPVDGTVSTAANALGPYEFLDDRILAAADFFWQFMLGYDTPWTPVAYAISPDGTIRDTYNHISNAYKGRMNTANFWDMYYYYTYVRGINIAEKAPHYYEAFTKRLPSNFYYGGTLNKNWDNVDGGGDFWLYMPEEAASEGAEYLPREQTSGSLIDIEDRYTKLGGNTTTIKEGDTSFVRFQATQVGSRIAFLNGSSSEKIIGFRIRTTGPARLELTPGINDTLTLPDTHGKWRYVTYTLDSFQSLNDILYMKVTGSDTTVDMDHIHIKASEQLTPPVFKTGNSGLSIFAYPGSPIRVDFEATDAGGLDVVTYSSPNLPQGAALNEATGEMLWQPGVSQTGTHSFHVAASDGTTITTRDVKIVVSANRASAVEQAIATYDEDRIYVAATLNSFHAVYEDILDQLDTASDEVFYGQLQELAQAAEAMKLVTPLLEQGGGIDYHNIVASSTFGTDIANMVDGDNQTGVSYTRAPNLYHMIDFGPDFKVSATSFGFQSNIFADRLAKSAVFGSNDGENWVRLTPGLTAFTQSFQTLDVASEYQDDSFRFIKVQLLHPQPDVLYGIVRNLFEMTEFRIYGERHETGNKLESVSIFSDQSVSGKIATGDTVQLKIQAKEAIQNVTATIQGIAATVTTQDQILWTALATMGDDVPTGTVKFTVDYEQSDGTTGERTVLTTDDSKLFLVDGGRYIDVSMMAKVKASDKQWPGNGLSQDEVGYLLFDGDTSTYGDLNTSSGSFYTVDFGEGLSVRLDEIVLMPRASNSSRMNGLVIQGSNDNSNWTDLTQPLKGSQEGTWSDIRQDQLLNDGYYRYLKLYNNSAWSGNVAEVEFYGDVDYDAEVVDSKVVAPEGYTQGSYYLYMQEVNRIKASLTEPDANKMALLKELIAAKTMLISVADLFPPIHVDTAMVLASSISWDGKVDAMTNGYRAFDGDPATSPDTKTAAGWTRVDLGVDHTKVVGSIRFIPRTGNAARMNGALIQGSNDGVSFDTLYTVGGVSEIKWYKQNLSSRNAYRYLRYYTPNGFANIGELEFYEKNVDRTLLTLLMERANAVNEEDYTGESYAQLHAAVTTADAVDTDLEANQNDVDSASNSLKMALGSLVSI
ncbi:discoidin domain-containing protein [Paenibacillus taichungensis]|uniref:discoidin domain-containing protein n=1 Tax=Paenibacillus taichungensis TaxID=484184 RepID=UPI0039A42C46